MLKECDSQGYGRHSKEERIHITLSYEINLTKIGLVLKNEAI